MSESKVKIGIIGANFISQQCHLPSFDSLLDCEIIALADMREDLLHEVANKYNIKKRYLSHKELIEDKEIDGVVIVVPRAYTADVAYDCLKAGKHVLTEKPMALNYQVSKKLVDIAEQKKVHYLIGYMKRFDEGVEAAKGIILTKLNCKPTLINVNCFGGNSYCSPFGDLKSKIKPPYTLNKLGYVPDWLDDNLEKGYLTYLNTFCHTINLIRFFLDSKCEVLSVNLNDMGEGIVLFDFDGIPISFSSSNSDLHGWNESLEFIYTDSKLTVNLPPALLKNVPAKIVLEENNDRKGIFEATPNWSWAFKNQAQNFIDIIDGKKKPINSAKDALLDMKIIEEIWKRI